MTAKICQNPKCSKIFETTRNNKLYCCRPCKTYHVNMLWNKSNKDKVNASSQKYKHNNRDIVNELTRKRLKNNINFKISCILRTRICNVIKTQQTAKIQNSIDLIGCTIQQCREYIESLWTKGMSWENHGKFGWHIDHIKPCDSFNLVDPVQQKQCFHYTNLQPLWWKDNLSKGNRY